MSEFIKPSEESMVGKKSLQNQEELPEVMVEGTLPSSTDEPSHELVLTPQDLIDIRKQLGQRRA